MLSKCANPTCSEIFRYLREGKIFRLTPSPTLQATGVMLGSLLTERFWLCDRCAKEMTVVWAGTRAQVAPLPQNKQEPAVLPLSPPPKGPQKIGHHAWRPLAAAAGRDDC